MAPAIPVAIALAKAAAAKIATSAVGVAVKGAVTKIASSAMVTGLKSVGAKIASSAFGQGVKAVAGKVAGSAFGQGVKSVGSKVVTGLAKAKSSGAVRSLADTVVNQGAMSAFQSATQPKQTGSMMDAFSLTGDDTTTKTATLDTGKTARTDSYNDSVFGSAMSLSQNTFAGESGGSGSGIFGSLLKSKNTLR